MAVTEGQSRTKELPGPIYLLQVVYLQPCRHFEATDHAHRGKTCFSVVPRSKRLPSSQWRRPSVLYQSLGTRSQGRSLLLTQTQVMSELEDYCSGIGRPGADNSLLQYNAEQGGKKLLCYLNFQAPSGSEDDAVNSEPSVKKLRHMQMSDKCELLWSQPQMSGTWPSYGGNSWMTQM
jgi:hypothetical protein